MKYKLTITEARLDGRYFRQLDLILDDLFRAATERGWNWRKLAGESGLSDGTVYRLGWRETRRPQFRTVIRLAHSLGMEVETVHKKPAKGRRVA